MDYIPPPNEVMPMEAVVVAIPVLVFSIISMGFIWLLVLMQHYHSERWGCAFHPQSRILQQARFANVTHPDVGLMALSVALSSLGNICQQFWYIFHWRHDRTSEFEQAKHGLETPNLTVGPLTKGPSLILFWIQMYFHNVTA